MGKKDKVSEKDNKVGNQNAFAKVAINRGLKIRKTPEIKNKKGPSSGRGD